MSTETQHPSNLSSALEDYLETIFELVRDNKLARIKDIAKARNVKSASVIPAMRKLSEQGLITYVKREYIDLTPDGEMAARRIYARHKLLSKFLKDILGMPQELAQIDACSMEHSLSDNGMDHLVRFFEFLQSCPEGDDFIKRFGSCALVNSEESKCTGGCSQNEAALARINQNVVSLKELKPGQSGRVLRISGTGAIRQRILDMGLMPDVQVELERVSPAGDPIWIKFQGSQLSLRLKEAEMVIVKSK